MSNGVSKRLGSPYRSGRSAHWVKVKNPECPSGHTRGGRGLGAIMGLIISLIVSIVLAAVIVWIAARTSGRESTALDILNQRLARGEIDRAECDEKRKLIGW
jgi:uncharacterized membrane protein